ncbi:MAG TPA: aspartyl-phosphate phosphatase Spo0E family protein [Clostridium sp.]
MEETRDKLNMLIATKDIITEDKELLEISIKLDKLLNKYFHTKNNELAL